MASNLGVSFRPAKPGDDELLFTIYASTREDEMKIVPWAEEQKTEFLHQQFTLQKTHYRHYLPDTEYLLIEQNEKPVGRLYLDRHDDELRIVDIAILTEHRGRGIGGAILSDLIDEATHRGVPVRIHVERNNPALGLYRRLGFSEIGDEGVYLHMERATTRVTTQKEMAR